MAKNKELDEPKNKDPAVLFYTADFLVGVTFMTMSERGEYITLLCMQHQSGHIAPDDFASITQSKKVISKFEKDENGFFFQRRMETEMEKRAGSAETRSRAASIAANARWQRNAKRMRDAYPTNAIVMPPENENINENINISNNSDSIFPFSKQQQTTTYIYDTYTREEFAELYRSIREYFREEGYISDAQTFIQYNLERSWRGCGGEDALDNWIKYAKAWERKERIRHGVDVNELRGAPMLYG